MIRKLLLLPSITTAIFGVASSAVMAQTTPPTPPTTTPAVPPVVGMAAPTGPTPGSVTVTGLVDIYYEVNGRAPSNGAGGSFTGVPTVGGGAIGVDNAGRAFDINDREVSLSLAEVNIFRAADKSFPVSITATLTGGDTARLVHSNEPGGTSGWQYIQQLFISKTSHFWDRDFTFDAGIFTTPLGLEVIESSSNDNYTRSFGFQFAVPLYHAGVRVSVPITKNLTGMVAGVNGWNNIADDNNGKSIIAQLTYKPTAKLSGIFSFMGGPEGTGAFGPGVPTNGGGSVGISLGEFQPTYMVNDKLKLSADFIYGRAAGTVLGVQGSGSWLSMAGYAKYQLTKRFSIAGRLEQFEDIPGVGGVGVRTGGLGYTKLNEATITFEYLTFRSKLVTRLEYRHDHANKPGFGEASGAAVLDQDTMVLGEVYKF